MKFKNAVKIGLVALLIGQGAQALPIKDREEDFVIVNGKNFKRGDFMNIYTGDGEYEMIYWESKIRDFLPIHIFPIEKKLNIFLNEKQYYVERTSEAEVEFDYDEHDDILYYEHSFTISSDSDSITQQERDKIEFAANTLCWLDEIYSYSGKLKIELEQIYNSLFEKKLADAPLEEMFPEELEQKVVSPSPTQNIEQQKYQQIKEQKRLDEKQINLNYDSKISQLELELKQLEAQIEPLKTQTGNANAQEWIKTIKGLDKGGLQGFADAYGGTEQPLKQQLQYLENDKEIKELELKGLKEIKELELDALDIRYPDLEQSYSPQESYTNKSNKNELLRKKAIELFKNEMNISMKKAENLENSSIQDMIEIHPSRELIRYGGEDVTDLIYLSYFLKGFEKAYEEIDVLTKQDGIRTIDCEYAPLLNDMLNIMYIKLKACDETVGRYYLSDYSLHETLQNLYFKMNTYIGKRIDDFSWSNPERKRELLNSIGR